MPVYTPTHLCTNRPKSNSPIHQLTYTPTGHELGIPAHQVPVDGFRFVTRLHYCAPDSETYGAAAEWGEHEMDYILLAKVCLLWVVGVGGWMWVGYVDSNVQCC